MGTVKYTGPVASFHCPTNAEIRSLKVHFSPKQEGTGDPSPENVRPIVGWDGVVVHNDAIDDVPRYNIPLDYQRVEYIDSKDGAYFQVPFDINTNQTLSVQAKLQYLGTLNNNVWLAGDGRYINSTQFEIGIYGNAWYKPTGATTQVEIIKSAAAIAQQLVIISLSRKYTAATTLTWRMFGRYGYGEGDNGLFNTRTYFLNISIDNTPIYNFIPCRRKSDNKPGMYDTVSGEFFTNQGTGEFICGPDVGGTTDYEFGVLGKNKLDKSLLESGTFDAQGRPINNIKKVRTTWIPVVEGQTYTPSVESDKQVYAYQVKNNNDEILYHNDNSQHLLPTSYTIPSGGTAMRIAYAWPDPTSSTAMAVSDVTSPQLELGSTATEYEPYDPKHTVYGGWVDLISGEVCEKYYKLTFDGTEVMFGSYTTNEADFIRIMFEDQNNPEIKFGLKSSEQNIENSKYSHGAYTIKNTDNTFSHGACVANNDNTSTFAIIHLPKSIYTSNIIEDVKTYLTTQYNNGTPVEICYEIAEPIYYNLAPTQLQTFLGHNNVWSNADYVEVEYDLHETQDILARKQFIIANQPHLEEVSGSIATFNTDMSAPLKECKVYFNPVQQHQINNKNLYNLETTTIGYNIDSSGAIEASVRMQYSDFIEVEEGENYIYKGYQIFNAAAANDVRILGYDEDYNFVQQITYGSPVSNQYLLLNYIIPTGIKYIRIVSTAIAANQQVEKGDTPSDYRPYYYNSEINGITNFSIYNNSNDSNISINLQNSIFGGYYNVITGDLVVTYWVETLNPDNIGSIGSSSDNELTNYFTYTMPYKYIRINASDKSEIQSGSATTNGILKGGKSNFLSQCSGGMWYSTKPDLLGFSAPYLDTPYTVCIRLPRQMTGTSNSESATEQKTKITTFLNNNTIQIGYDLKEPLIYRVGSQNNLKSIIGTNSIWSNANGNIELAYWSH